MSTRRTGILTALLLTAALMCAMPGLWQSVIHTDPWRVDDSLRPPQTETLTVWLLPGQIDDQKLIRQCCSAFEKEQQGVRVFLRRVTAEELTDPESVLPDAVLFETGSIANPEQILLPLTGMKTDDASGIYAGLRYAVPLWLEANVLSLPSEWFDTPAATPEPSSFFALESTAPPQEDNDLIRDVPWTHLLQPGALKMPEGIALQQLLMTCPNHLRQTLAASLLSPAQPSPTSSAPAAWSSSQPVSRSAKARPAPVIQKSARIETIGAHLSAVEQGEALQPCLLSPAASDRVRYAAICRQNSHALAFLQFLQNQQKGIVQSRLIPASGSVSDGNVLMQAALALYQQGMMLPNAFEHPLEALHSLCLDRFRQLEDPAQTLLRLR